MKSQQKYNKAVDLLLNRWKAGVNYGSSIEAALVVANEIDGAFTGNQISEAAEKLGGKYKDYYENIYKSPSYVVPWNNKYWISDSCPAHSNIPMVIQSDGAGYCPLNGCCSGGPGSYLPQGSPHFTDSKSAEEAALKIGGWTDADLAARREAQKKMSILLFVLFGVSIGLGIHQIVDWYRARDLNSADRAVMLAEQITRSAWKNSGMADLERLFAGIIGGLLGTVVFMLSVQSFG